MRVLLLGGTAEARALAQDLHRRADITVTYSLAGVTREPWLPAEGARLGGFGGTAGLVRYLDQERIDVLIDATHPFADTMTAHAQAATAELSRSMLVLRRPGWIEQPGDDWRRVASLPAAARVVAELPVDRVFLATGSGSLAAFAADPGHHYFVRAIQPPVGAAPTRLTVITSRPPYPLEAELTLLRAHGIEVLVTRDSGAPTTAAKLAAARQLGLPVVMIERPALPAGVAVRTSVTDTLAWLEQEQARSRGSSRSRHARGASPSR